jgi:hypothetical protein
MARATIRRLFRFARGTVSAAAASGVTRVAAAVSAATARVAAVSVAAVSAAAVGAAALAAAGGALIAPGIAAAQPPAARAAAVAPREAATLDLTGYWVAVVTEDWKYRMVTPAKGVYEGIPLTAAGRRAADGWDPARDASAGEQCRSYGAASIMRAPGRLHITWADADTLRIETDAGTQTRLLEFAMPDDAVAAPEPEPEPSWQGFSAAEWQRPAAQAEPGSGGILKVVTTRMRPGYLRKNGVPYGANATLTEYFNRHAAPNGDAWLVVTQVIEDPEYLARPYVSSVHFKKLRDGTGWNPTECSAS